MPFIPSAAQLQGDTAIGRSQLVYRYTVTGSDKASIDTGVDTPDAGDNDWSGGDLLEVFIVARSDVAAIASTTVNIVFNNDTSAVYSRQVIRNSTSTVIGAAVSGESNWTFQIKGNSVDAGTASAVTLVIPAYAATVFSKTGRLTSNIPSDSTSNTIMEDWSMNYAPASPAAITRLKLALGGSEKFKVGTEILIYKRLSS